MQNLKGSECLIQIVYFNNAKGNGKKKRNKKAVLVNVAIKGA